MCEWGSLSGSGKSYSVALYLVLLTFEKSRTILFARYTMSSVAISIFPEFIDKIETLGLSNHFEITKSEIINKSTGSKIIFKGIKTGSGNQTANLKSIAGIDTLVIDESEEIDNEETFDKIDLSVRSNQHHNKIILLFNPTTKESWLYKRFYLGKGVFEGTNLITDDVTYIHTTYEDIEDKLPESFLKQLKMMKHTNPDKFKHIVLGGFLNKVEGTCFNNWEIGDFTKELDYIIGIDFGFVSDPSAAVKVAVNSKTRIIYLEELIYKPFLTTGDIYNLLKSEGRREIIGDNSEPRLIEELKRAGLNIKPCQKGAGSVKEGILLMNDYKIIVSPNSTNIIKELNHYRWSDTKKETPVDLYNHIIDASRYACTHIIKRPTALRLR